MKRTRTKLIIGIVALFTAGSLFAFKGKMIHHKKAKMENCQKMNWDGDEKIQKKDYQLESRREVTKE